MVWRALLSALLKPVLYVAALVTSWFGGKKSAQTDIRLQAAKHDLKVVRAAEEIEDSVEGLTKEELLERAKVWVRNN
jgi:hypothetical protein